MIREEQPGERDTRLHGRWLVLMRVVWVLVVVLSVGLFIVSVPFNFEASQAICFFWRKSHERVALVASFYLVTFGAAFQGSNLLLTLHPVLRVLLLGLAFVGNACAGFFFYLFPTGHFAPRWTRWLLVVWIAYWGNTNLLSGSILTGSGLIDTLLFVGFLASVVAIQVYRYRRVSTLTQRQQTKWVVYGLSVALVGFLLLIPVGFDLSLQLGIIADLVGAFSSTSSCSSFRFPSESPSCALARLTSMSSSIAP
jgi:hypothetical protein